MLRKLIGSSNVKRTYKTLNFSEYPKFEMVKCTNEEVFMVALCEIRSGKGNVIVSVLENILCESVSKIDNLEAINTALENLILEYLELVKTAANKMPDIKFTLAQPTLRPAQQWFTDGHEAFCKKLADGIKLMDKSNV
jgi:hypothetical protein